MLAAIAFAALMTQLPDAPADARLTTVRDTGTRFSMTPFATKAEWDVYADAMRRRMLVACGLWPMPPKSALNAQVFDWTEHDGYAVAKVTFEAFPGYLVTGNLYQPSRTVEGTIPAVINPHGHWPEGRLADDERGSVPARCIAFARMGMAAFSYDMAGYVDSRQLTMNWGHSGGNIAAAERQRQHLWGIHPFGVQLLASIRALDFMETLPYVDTARLGCTGASGGGTQTFALAAVDDRVRYLTPVNMISHSMQGGCPCENAPLIRMHASNMEIGAMAAPRPMLMVSATGDWTRATYNVEFPAVQSVYELFGAADRVWTTQIDEGHNFNQLSREAVYAHYLRFALGLSEEESLAYREPAYTTPPAETLEVFPGEGTPEGLADEAAVIADLQAIIAAKWDAGLPKTYTDRPPFRSAHVAALGDAFGLHPVHGIAPAATEIGSEKADAYTVTKMIVRVPETGAVIPAAFYTPNELSGAAPALVVHGDGAAALLDASGAPGPYITALLAQGRRVAVADLFRTGSRSGERLYGAFPDTFMPTDTAYRVQDILAVSKALRAFGAGHHSSELIGLGEAGLWALFAAALDDAVAHTAADLAGFNPDDDAAWVARHYVPCVRSLGDVRTAAYLVAPRGLWLMNAAPDYDPAPLDKAFTQTGVKGFQYSPAPESAEAIAAALK